MSLPKFLRFLKSKSRAADGSDLAVDTGPLLALAHETFTELATKFNAGTDSDSLQVSVSKLTEDPPSNRADSRRKRFSVANAFWAISVRCEGSRIDFFVLPSVQLPLRENAETAARLKLKFTVRLENETVSYFMDDVPLGLVEARTLMAALFKDILQKSKADFDFIPENVRVQFDNQSLTAAVRELIREKSVLTDRIAGQQDTLQSFIAAEIHDTVISDLLFMLRKIESDAPLDKVESTKLIEGVVSKLRELCAELVPRNLGDWGLAVLLEDLFNKMCVRSGLRGTFLCIDPELPDFPPEIELQIFRIVQECLNNVEKHARATSAKLTIEMLDNELVITVSDDGAGYDESSSRRSGSGLSIMMERVGLIRLQMPASLQFDSKPGSGTSAVLKVQVAPTSVL